MQTPSLPFHNRRAWRGARGFSLIEIAVVLVIISVLLAIVAVPLATQIEQKRVDDTKKMLEGAKDALYGFAAANGRLPCPAIAGSAGQESPVGGGTCDALVGYLPAVTLGIAPVDAAGFAADAWADGTAARRIGYAVSNVPTVIVPPAGFATPALTTADGVKAATMTSVAAVDHLYVCATGLTSGPPSNNCGAMIVLTKAAPAVLFSLGKNSGINSIDEQNNQNSDKVFSSGTPNATFDDLVTWMSLNTLFDRMVRAGKLP